MGKDDAKIILPFNLSRILANLGVGVPKICIHVNN